MYTQAKYKCAICGQIYDELRERINCESACLKRQEEEEKKAAELKKKNEQETRHNALNMLIEQAITAVMCYIDDYGSYEYDGKLVDEMDLPTMLKMLHYFVF
jgi:hypothetical protein